VGRALDFGGGAFDAGEDGGEVVDCLVIFAFFYVASASHQRLRNVRRKNDPPFCSVDESVPRAGGEWIDVYRCTGPFRAD